MEKIWLQHYPEGVPTDINPDVYRSVVDMFEQTVEQFRKNPALYNMGSSMTYGELDKKTHNFAAYLQNKLHLQKGDRLAVMLPNSMQYFVAMLGALRAGLVVVNVNPLYTARELEHQLIDAEVKTIVVLENFVHTIEQILPKTPLEHIIISELGDMFSSLKSGIINFAVKKLKKMVPAYKIDKPIYLRSAIKKGRHYKLNPVEIYGDDIAFLQYTGGTTGVSKGAMLTHRNIIANVEQAYAWMSSGGNLEPGKEIAITALPLYHIFSLMANCFVFMKIGVYNILITNPKNIGTFLKEIGKHKFTVITGVNTLFKAMMRHKRFSEIDFSHLKISLGGGMAVHENVAKLWKQKTGNVLLEGYGLTETSPVVCCNPLNLEEYSGNIGFPIPSTEIKVVDDDYNEVPFGEAGELCVYGPQVMKGYWNKPDETANMIMHDGWLRTGDVVKVDEKGRVKIVDRKKDMLVVSGFNVYPSEIEEVIGEHPDVLEVAVIGVTTERTGEYIKAFVVRKDPLLSREALMAYCIEHLTTYKMPKKIEFRDELPKSNVGKILRRVLREEEESKVRS